MALMINKMRVLIYSTNLGTLNIHLENTIKYWENECKFTGDAVIEESILDGIRKASEECKRQIEQLSDYPPTASAQRKAHEDFERLIIKDTQNIRGMGTDRFPINFLIGSLSIPYILDSMDKFNQEVRKLERDNLECSLIRENLNDYMELVKNIIE